MTKKPQEVQVMIDHTREGLISYQTLIDGLQPNTHYEIFIYAIGPSQKAAEPSKLEITTANEYGEGGICGEPCDESDPNYQAEVEAKELYPKLRESILRNGGNYAKIVDEADAYILDEFGPTNT
ncbi:hypothetical protein Ciccas_007764 [Cichlidogyrus casuarinus]|uniref:Fibronectin type-III domain-containing protein n=1 Tax=Cichlidogyrus casuarinus TaxID=1844966 RepID=A0ABD2Q4J9_9PLAT